MQPWKKILYVFEEGVDHASAIARTVALAEHHRADLTVLDVIPTSAADLREEIFAFHATALDPLLAPHRGRINISEIVAVGTVFVEVILAVLRDGYDLVTKVAEAPDYLQRLFGSTDMHLLRKCPCPLWLMKPQENMVLDKVLAAIDFDPLPTPNNLQDQLNQRILAIASSLASQNSASLHLVHAWEAFAEGTMRARADHHQDFLDRYFQKEQAAHQGALAALVDSLSRTMDEETFARLNLGLHLPKGAAIKVIPQLANDLATSVVVMGTVARTGIPGLIIGNTAEAILDQLTCSVLAVKPPGFVSPVQLWSPPETILQSHPAPPVGQGWEKSP